MAISSLNIIAQDISGQWNGSLEVSGVHLRLVFHINKTDSGYSATMDSPDQGAKGIPVTTTTFENNHLLLKIENAKIEYDGEFKDSVIIGTFKQNGFSFPMTLSRKEVTNTVKRPQEPKAPFPYYLEEVTFPNKNAGITLAGTLTLPAKTGNFPAVILITGSGPQNRDEELAGHKPFLVLADHLTKNGIAVLRYDDRGVGASAGDFSKATTNDFATDVESAVSFLKTRNEINKDQIGLIGHSEGGLIAPIVATKSKGVDFIVLLAGPGLSGDQLMLLQKQKIEEKMGVPAEQVEAGQQAFKGAYEIIRNSPENDTSLKSRIQTFFKEKFGTDIPEAQLSGLTTTLLNPWMISFLKLDPAIALQKVKCPVLAINGDKDLQVPAKENLSAIKNALGKAGNKNVTIKEYPGLNHLFQEAKTGLPAEYMTIKQTISPQVLEDITGWIKKQVK
jgi:fermentation-respiration switch protein FrsA (DUF1100 family)